MKMILALLLMIPLVASATITAEEEFAINRLSGTARKYSLGSLVHKNVNVVVGKYSYAVQGGAAGNINLLSDLNDTGSTITIPSKAVIKQVWIDVITAPVGASVAVTLQSAADLKASTAEASFTGILAGIPVGVAANMIKLTADRVLKTALVGTGTAGKWNVYVEYVLGD